MMKPLRAAAVWLFVLDAACGRYQDVPSVRDAGPHRDSRWDSGGTVDARPPDGSSSKCREDELRCFGPDLQVCRGGTWVMENRCEFGCAVGQAGPHCGDPIFSNGIEMEDFDQGLWDIVLGPGEVIVDTDTLTISGPGAEQVRTRVIDRGGSGLPDIAVFSFHSLQISSDCTIRVRGSRIPAFVASSTIRIDGILDVSAGPDGTPGPGGWPGGADGEAGQGPGGGGPGDLGPVGAQRAGGGGGGFGDLGGRGGSTAAAQGGPAGARYGSPTLDPILGGSGGGSGAWTSGANPGKGGGGGGAVLVFSLEDVVVGPNGVVDAGGGGGQAGQRGNAGGGGGSGGAIFLFAPRVTIMGVLAANGGGGGGADSGGDGQDGRRDATPAAAGQGGGQGGAGAASAGSDAEAATLYGSGGGGACGRIRIESRDPPDISGLLSPGRGTHAVSIASIPVQ